MSMSIGILEGEFDFLGKRSLAKKTWGATKRTVKIATTPQRAVLRVATKIANPVLRPVQNTMKKVPVLRTIDSSMSASYNLATGRTSKSIRQVKTTGRNVVKDTKVAGHLVMELARKIVTPIASKIIGSNPGVSRVAAKSLIIPPATAAVASSTAAAPAAPLVPVILDKVISEIYSKLGARKALAKDLSDPTMPGMDFTNNNSGTPIAPGMPTPTADEPAPEASSGMPSWAIPAAIGGGVLLLLVMKKKK